MICDKVLRTLEDDNAGLASPILSPKSIGINSSTNGDLNYGEKSHN
jgi:hypothetical protein